VLILTDLFGGTPTNLAMTFYEAGKVEILTGVNLPMLIKAILLRRDGSALIDSLTVLREKGQTAMVSASEVLTPDGGEGI
jgi:PTS system mannose-specific IIA component